MRVGSSSASVVDKDRLIGARGVFDDRDGVCGVGAVHQQAALNEAGGALSHVDGGHFARAGKALPVVIGKAFHVMPCQKADAAVACALGQALTDGGNGGRGRGDAGHDVPTDTGGFDGVDLFVEAPEKGCVAALQADDLRALPGMRDDQVIDLILGLGGPEPFLACIDEQRFTAGKLENFGANQPVVNDHVCLIEGAAGLERQKFRIARPGADERHMARCAPARSR